MAPLIFAAIRIKFLPCRAAYRSPRPRDTCHRAAGLQATTRQLYTEIRKSNTGQTMDDADQSDRLAKLKDAVRRRSARQSQMHQLLSQDKTDIEDKIATVRTVQREDRTRVISAITSLMGQNGHKPD